MSISKCTENQQLQFKPATDMVLSTFFAHAFELVPLPKITSHHHQVGPIHATPATRSIAVASVPITLGSPLRCSTWLQSKAGVSMSCMCATTRENLTFASRKTSNLRTSERRPSTLAYKLARVSARATSASTCLFANRLHALASKDMCAKPMTPKIQVAVELPATLMLLGDTEGWYECRWRSQKSVPSCLEVI